MSKQWMTTTKPAFQTELLGLDPKDLHLVMEKVAHLVDDPHPDGKLKKTLKGTNNKVFRVRAGKYRVIYTYDDAYVSLLSLRRRDESTYDDEVEPEFLGGLDAELPETPKPDQHWDRIMARPESSRKIPEPITAELLNRLRVNAAYHTRLMNVETEDELLEVPGVPEDVTLRLYDYLFERPLEERLQQPDYIAQDVSDLIRFKEGSLLAFLLRLDPDQEKFVTWGVDGKGPTLVKGGPGTGKSTIAIYRARSLLKALSGESNPRILFTTYTNALVAFSRQLLEQLLGDDARHVTVETVDKIARDIVLVEDKAPKFVNARSLPRMMREALDTVRLDGNTLERKAQEKTLARLGPDYLRDEILSVIEARGFTTVKDYLEAGRPGRGVGLNAVQRQAVWAVRERLGQILDAEGVWTWERLRSRAADLVAQGRGPAPYDAVIVDEAQDLNPSALRMLAGLCKAPNRLFVTADANQSIYGSGFRWSDVHDSLQFRGRTGVLRSNYRSTREIGLAATSYLGAGGLEVPEEKPHYVREGAIPAVRGVTGDYDEAELLALFLRGAAREFHLGMSSCAILVPTEKGGAALADRLREKGIEIEFMKGRELDLRKPVAKVITLKSAKGLEFPVVALAGFIGARYPVIPDGTPEEAVPDIVNTERRTMFVAMTRAMRGLLVVSPTDADSPLYQGFDPALWNLGHSEAR